MDYEKIKLQPFSLAGAEELFALVNENRTYLRKTLPWLDTNTELVHTQNFLNETLEKIQKGESGMAYFITIEDKIVGVIDTHHIEHDKNMFQVGYWLAEKYQGRGIITDACNQVLEEMFARGFSLAEIRCAVNNPKSCAIAERLGFEEKDTLLKESKMYGEMVDMRVWHLENKAL